MTRATRKDKKSAGSEDLDDLFQRSEYSLCLSLLGDRCDAENYLLRQRCLLRLRRFSEIIQPGSLSRIATFPERLRVSALALLGAAYHRRDMRIPAESAFRDAYAIADSLALNDEERAELHYYDAFRLWSLHEFEKAERLLIRVLPVASWRVHALSLLSWISAAQLDLKQQLGYIDEALELATEPYSIGTLLQTATHLACELFDEVRFARYAETARRLAWSTDMTTTEFFTFRSLGWCAMLKGQYFDAYAHFERAMKAKPRNHASQVLIGADRAHLAMIMGDYEARDRLMAHAYSTMRTVHWPDASSERTALLNLSVLYAVCGMPSVAAECLETYHQVQTRIEPHLAFGIGDQRLFALEQYAQGWTDYADCRYASAMECFKQAFRLWNQFGYTWRATLAALVLKRYGRYSALQEYVERHVDHIFRRAWFASEVHDYRGRVSHPIIKSLPQRLGEMVLLILDGFSNDEIAEALSLSPKSVRNRLTEVYARFEVKGRAKLRTRLKDLGLR